MTGHVDIIYQQSRNLTIIYHLQEAKEIQYDTHQEFLLLNNNY
tara:strand:+ start:390 stop:518 length:129 start_codon:yes stop_codon:yes gene_type:complete